MYEQRWGRYPTLAGILTNKSIDEGWWYGASSASESIFDQINDLVKVFALVNDNSAAIREFAAVATRDERRTLEMEVTALQEHLRLFAKFFDDAERKVSSVLG